VKKLIPAIILVVFLLYLAEFSFFGNYTNYESTFYGTRYEDATAINAQFHLDREPAVLYLEPGDAPYFIHANSSCRYISALLISRYRDNWNLTNLPQYWDEYHCVASYQGKYIVMELGGDKALDWFGENQTVRKPLLDIIWRNYTVVYNKSWRILEKN
jgi:hypothetical protein